MYFSDQLIRRLSCLPKVCPHFHLPLQSGDEHILRGMKRRYTPGQYQQIVQCLRDHFSDVEITTDIIVGFPGETEKQFDNTLRFARRMGFLKVHVFPFSARPGTLAEAFPDRIPSRIIKERCAELEQCARQWGLSRRKRYVGRTMQVLLEGREFAGGARQGFTANYIRVSVAGAREAANRIVDVRLTASRGEGLAGSMATSTAVPGRFPRGY